MYNWNGQRVSSGGFAHNGNTHNGNTHNGDNHYGDNYHGPVRKGDNHYGDSPVNITQNFNFDIHLPQAEKNDNLAKSIDVGASTPVIDHLMEVGAEPDAVGSDGMTALDHASLKGRDHVVEIIRENLRKKGATDTPSSGNLVSTRATGWNGVPTAPIDWNLLSQRLRVSPPYEPEPNGKQPTCCTSLPDALLTPLIVTPPPEPDLDLVWNPRWDCMARYPLDPRSDWRLEPQRVITLKEFQERFGDDESPHYLSDREMLQHRTF